MQIISVTGKVAFEDAVIRTVNINNGRDQKQVLSFKVSTIDYNGKKVDGNFPQYIFDCTMWKRVEYLAGSIVKGADVTVIGHFSTNEYNGKTYLKINVIEASVSPVGKVAKQEQPQPKPTEAPADVPEIDVNDLEVQMPF